MNKLKIIFYIEGFKHNKKIYPFYTNYKDDTKLIYTRINFLYYIIILCYFYNFTFHPYIHYFTNLGGHSKGCGEPLKLAFLNSIPAEEITQTWKAKVGHGPLGFVPEQVIAQTLKAVVSHWVSS